MYLYIHLCRKCTDTKSYTLTYKCRVHIHLYFAYCALNCAIGAYLSHDSQVIDTSGPEYDDHLADS
jgi:hypothetical protein